MINIQFYGPVYSCSGYARIRHLLVELNHLGINIQIKPFSIYDKVDYKDLNILKGLESNKISKPFIHISCGIPLQFKKNQDAAYNIGYTMFEATKLPQIWINACNEMDEIWVPSISNLKLFEMSEIKVPIKLIPYGVDLDLFKEEKMKKDLFTFLSIGTFIDRKGWDILLQAFLEEFNNRDKVQLLIKLDGTNKYAEKEINNILSKYLYKPKVSICNKKLNDNMMPKLYSSSDCFVLPSRGEAFGLTFLESIACGIPVITSEYGGYNDFLSDDNTWFIKSKGLQNISPRLGKINPYYKDLLFHEPDKDDLKIKMRLCFENKKEYIKKVNGTKNILQFSYKSIAEKVLSRLKEIEGAL